uniref:Uncharacterized protein LOC114347331 n=1 Tax=Diabrotica virgifera virgifera TaxID=50390 RepID=A0A6P7H825_DIAVI
MLKSTLSLKSNIDISKYNKLIMFIKKKEQVMYLPKKSKTLDKEQVQKFISDAPNDVFLMIKVALIFGVSGALKKDELLKLETNNVQDLGSKFLVIIKASKTHTNRIFTIVDNEANTIINAIKSYISLRPAHSPHKRFFIFYKNSKCSTQPVGINTFSKIPSVIAKFLKLEHPHLYTGHYFRHSSASILCDSGAELSAINRLGGWKSTAVAEGYIDNSMQNKLETAEKLLGQNTTKPCQVLPSAPPLLLLSQNLQRSKKT